MVQTTAPPELPPRISILGLGLIGGSIGLGLAAARVVSGFDVNPDTVLLAQKLGAIHHAMPSAALAVADADLVILAGPVDANVRLLGEISNALQPHALVTDTGSVKEAICRAGKQLLGSRFIGGHPMAGGTGSGIRSAQGQLLNGAAWALIPADRGGISSRRYRAVEALVRHVGARPIPASAPEHDAAAALASHLPHLISWAYSGTVSADRAGELAHRLAGGSYRDMMRVAASNPELWSGILTANAARLEAAAAQFSRSFDTLVTAIHAGDAPALAELLRASAADKTRLRRRR
ncbi:MAG: prephenate dehydrogenase/arogenate dehydrogenase family protein [Armatimonadetes bacterium]|nr:prephenate dehydrogenase/arogenate dehydrogenase family protein [Armatimonadota bacterium]MDE2207600.1 prephenate dehydrogenase/arogenate dehydrogenase family protein [Armatimonadota bacterium]